MIWLALGISLTTATQLRLSIFPVGPGEILVLIWIISVITRLFLNKKYLLTTLAKTILLFWIFALASLFLGLNIAYLIERVSPNFYHDTLAFFLVFLFSITFAISVNDKKTLQKIISFFLLFTITFLSIIMFYPLFIPFLDPWYLNTRFQGWANNPNQLGLLASTIPFFSLYLYNSTINSWQKKWYLLSIVLSSIIGIATQSDSVTVGWSLAIITIVVLQLYKIITNYIVNNLRGLELILFKQITIVIILLFCCAFIYIFHEQITTFSSNVYNENSQGEYRIRLWENGIYVISISPLFGLGPGAHSGGTQPLFYVQEAHNTFIDWTASSGIFGLLSYIVLLGWIAWNTWKSGSIILLVTLVSLISFTTFGYMLRHIIFWFYLLAIAGLSIPDFQQVAK